MSKTEKILYAVLAVLVWVYVALRAIYVPISIDEAGTFFKYVITGNIWPGSEVHWDANNHIFNSFLARISYLIFGAEEWALRLPVVLISLVYFFYVYLISSKLENKVLRWALISALLFSHFFLEFFALSRGYGISMALFTACLYHAGILMKKVDAKHLVAFTSFLILATLSNLTLFNSYLILIAIVGIRQAILCKTEQISFWPLIIAFPILLGVLYWFGWYGFELKNRDLLYFGSDSFWIGTVIASMNHFTFFRNTIGLYVLVALFIAIVSLFFYFIFRHRFKDWFTFGNLVTLVLIGNIIANFLMHYLMGTKYLMDRTAIIYFPMLILSICFSVDETSTQVKKYLAWLVMVVMVFFPFNFIAKSNLYHVELWPNDACLKGFMEQIREDYGDRPEPPNVAVHRLLEQNYAYYNFLSGGYFNPALDYERMGDEVDYQIVGDGCDDCGPFKKMDYDEVSRQSLMKRTTFLEREDIYTVKGISTEGVTTDEFKEFGILKIDSIAGAILQLKYKFTLTIDEKPIPMIFAIQILGDDGLIKDKQVHITLMEPVYKGEKQTFSFITLLSKMPPEARDIKVFIWSIKQLPFDLAGGEMTLTRLKDD